MSGHIQHDSIIIGVETHPETVHLAVLNAVGTPVAHAEFSNRPIDCYHAVRWAQGLGTVHRAGVYGTYSSGSGIIRAFQTAGIEVAVVGHTEVGPTEVNPAGSRADRDGKSDLLDAYSAARAALAGGAPTVVIAQHNTALKALLTAQREAAKGRSAAVNQINTLLADAPTELQQRYRRHTMTTPLVRALARCRPSTHSDPATVAVLTACKSLARHIEFLDRQIRDLTVDLHAFITAVTPVRAARRVEVN